MTRIAKFDDVVAVEVAPDDWLWIEHAPRTSKDVQSVIDAYRQENMAGREGAPAYLRFSTRYLENHKATFDQVN
jgi:hypothetical protein